MQMRPPNIHTYIFFQGFILQDLHILSVYINSLTALCCNFNLYLRQLILVLLVAALPFDEICNN